MNGLSDMVNREKKDIAQIVVWNGLNRTDGATDGFLSDCLNLTSDNYPTLSPRKGRGVSSSYSSPTSLYAWDAPVVVSENILYYDGEAIVNVLPGDHQFAVVGTRLIVWPDKLVVDLTNNEYFYIDDEIFTTGLAGSVTFTDSTIAANTDAAKAKDQALNFSGRYTEWRPIFYAYGTDPSAVEACYQNGAWDMEALELLQEVVCVYGNSSDPDFADNFPPGTVFVNGSSAIGHITIPQVSSGRDWTLYTLVYGAWKNTPDSEDITPSTVWTETLDLPDTTLYNSDGDYCVITNFEGVVTTQFMKWSSMKVHYDIYNALLKTTIFADHFQVGDTISVSGSRYGWYDKDRIYVAGIDVGTNTLTTGLNTFEVPICICVASGTHAAGKYRVKYNSVNYDYVLAEDIDATNVVIFIVLNGAQNDVVYWNTETKREVLRQTCADHQTTYNITQLTGTAYDTDTQVITFKRDCPDLDYICTWDNRLWGVCNHESNKVWNEDKQEYEVQYSRVIYGSALGMPWQFFDYSGLSTDSYAAVVASKGDFTGISAYSRSLCCFKEDMLYRVSGDYPAEYAVYDYNIAGVKEGCHKSLKIVNEVLYYKGRDGFYAYSGSTPRLISYVLGHNKGVAHATATERKYYAGLEYDDDTGELLVYDTVTNTWYKEDDSKVTDMTCFAGKVTFIADGKIYTEDDPDSTEVVEWSATFVRANETFHERKDYKWLRIRADMEEGSTLKAEVSIDRGEWITVLPTTTINGLKMIEMPIRNNRVDEYVLRLFGTGQGKIRSVVREFHEGSTAR